MFVFTVSLKTSWRRVNKTSWRHLENVLRTSWRRMIKLNIFVLIKTSWRCLLKTYAQGKNTRLDQNDLKTYGQGKYICLDQDILRTSWRHLLKSKTRHVFNTSSPRQMFAGLTVEIIYIDKKFVKHFNLENLYWKLASNHQRL